MKTGEAAPSAMLPSTSRTEQKKKMSSRQGVGLAPSSPADTARLLDPNSLVPSSSSDVDLDYETSNLSSSNEEDCMLESSSAPHDVMPKDIKLAAPKPASQQVKPL
ncbi:hypothetical protein ACJRO7_008588 [Eucalyptus globulus]|uniref:Uncharacterized protein n=1 Tax=Eucalyptus globulus TaxID=34317 RepID=A0ABD3IRW3_EUCGL